MRLNSIKNKLILTVLICEAVIIGTLITYSTRTSHQESISLAQKHVVTSARDQANKIKAEMSKILQSTQTLAQAFSAVKDPASVMNLNRESAKIILNKILVTNASFFSVYSIWEPDAFDLMDEAFTNLPGHDASGRFIPYWYRDTSGKISLEPARDYESRDKGDYYIIPRQTGKEAVIPPYEYTIGNQKILLMSLVSPIIFENRFFGVVGVDIPVQWLNSMLDIWNLYGNSSEMAVIAPNGMIAAAIGRNTAWGQPFSSIYPDLSDRLPKMRAGLEISTMAGNDLVIFSPFSVGHSSESWAVMISIPKSVILADATSKMWKQILISSVLALSAVLIISLFITRFLKPLSAITRASEKVALGHIELENIKTSNDEIGLMYQSFRRMIQSLQTISDAIRSIAIGDFSEKVELRSPEDVLGKAVNLMVDNIRKIVIQLNRIAEGSLAAKIQPFSDRDQLGAALYDMTESLKVMRERNDRQNAIKTGQMELNKAMRGDQDVTTRANRIITFLCQYLKARIGAFYIHDKDADVLQLTGTYAYQKRKQLSNEFKKGEGLVGQAMLENQIIQISDIPEDYVHISSGLGHSAPRNMVVVPLSLENTVKGVIELGSFHEFSPEDIQFLEEAAVSIAIAINSAQTRSKMSILLEQTRNQARQLTEQQNELRHSNRELEEQTTALKISESRLQAQQDELRQANEELQEQTQMLEEQKEDIQKKNLELEMAARLIEEKATALEKTSRYKSEFLANMSHELRTPLNSILLLSRLISDNRDNNLTDKQIEFARTIHSSGTDLLNLINEVLDLSKIEAGKMDLHLEEIPLKDIAAFIHRGFDPIAQNRELDFSVIIEDRLPDKLISDRQRIEQILKNFLSNAFKFTQEGRISLNIGRPVAGMDLSRSGLNPGKAIAFSVSDTGIGIPSDKQKQVFEAFKQADGSTSRKYGGTGLGLSISLELARCLGGEIQLNSQEGKGSTFTLILPESLSGTSRASEPETFKPDSKMVSEQSRNPDDRTGMDEKESASIRTPGIDDIMDDRKNLAPHDRKMLIIEDDPHFSKILCDLSREHGYKILVAGDGETGLHFADYYKPDAIILDVNLPGMDGWAVLDRLKSNSDTRHIPVHFISASDRPLNALKMGAIGYLTKPVSMEEMERVYSRIENTLSRPVKNLLVVEDDPTQAKAVHSLLEGADVHIVMVSTGQKASELLHSQTFDCMILDIGLPDMSGMDLLKAIRNEEHLKNMPVIIYTGKDMTRDEQAIIQEYADTIILKDVRSPEKLLDETSLFLHRMEADLPSEKKMILNRIHDRESIFRDKTILLVDDDMRNVYAIKSILEEKGMTVIVGKNGQEGIDRLATYPDIDLVLMDIMMPVMDGYEAMKKIRAKKAHDRLPIIALTAKAMKGDRSLCIEAGANDYLAKPFDTDKLLSMLRVWLY
ncbi:MAG: response regulator [Desulfatirhabdiaceae bacterium]